MAKLGISTGSAPNDGTGDSLLSGAIKINSNFNEIYSAIGDGTNITNRIAYATTAGFSTTSGYATTSGTSNYSTTSGFSTYSPVSGIATAANYSNTSGISTVAQFAQNLTGTPNISVGVVTASNYFGNASNLTGIITSIVAGTNVSVSLNGNVATINASGTGGGGTSSQWLSVLSGIVTSSNVGIGTTIANSSLQVNNGTISLTGTPGSNVAISLRDNHRITFGDSGISDSSVFFDGSKLNIRTSGSVNISDTSGRDVFSAVAGEGAILYYDNSRKFQTLTDGAYVNGNLGVLGIVTASNLLVSGISTFSGRIKGPVLFSKDGSATPAQIVEINNDGSAAFLNVGGSSSFYFDSPNTNIRNTFTNGRIRMDSPSGIDFEQYGLGGAYRARFDDGSVSLYSSNSLKFQTIGTGVTVTGTTFTNQLSVSGVSTFSGNASFRDNNKILLGNDGDFEIYFDSSNTILQNSNTNSAGDLYIRSDSTLIQNFTGSETLAQFNSNGAVSLYYDNLKKFETLGAGITVTGTTFTNQLNVSGVSTLSSNVSVGGTINLDGGVRLATNNPTIVGTSGTVGEIKRIGGAPFFYDGSAWREFVLSSGTPVSVPADTEWDNVVFRTTFDTDFTDAKFGATPVYVSAGSTIVGSPFKIGTGAFRNSGAAGAGVSYAYRSDYDFTGSWTIEFWMYHDSIPGTNTPVSLVSQVSTSDGSGDWTLGLFTNGVNLWWYWDNENSPTNAVTVDLISATTFNNQYVDKWVHYALVREGDNGSLHFYRDGVESVYTAGDILVDNDILHINGAGLAFGAPYGPVSINTITWNNGVSIDGIFDDVRISCGVGTAGQRYNSIGISSYATFTPPTTQLPITGTLSSVINPPGDKYGEITLGGSPTWRGTSGVTVTQQSSGNYRVSFASSYTNSNDYFVLTQAMDQGFASYVGVARSTTHVDFAINRESDNSAVNTGSLSVQIKNHI